MLVECLHLPVVEALLFLHVLGGCLGEVCYLHGPDWQGAVLVGSTVEVLQCQSFLAGLPAKSLKSCMWYAFCPFVNSFQG